MSPIDGTPRFTRIEIPDKTFFKIGEVAKLLGVEPYVLRYWESEFDLLEPEKTKSGQRVYQREDIELLSTIRELLYEEMFTIAGARRQLEFMREGKGGYVGGPGVVSEASEVAGATDQAAGRALDAGLLEELAVLERETALLRDQTEAMEREVEELRQYKAVASQREQLIARLHQEIAGLHQEIEGLREEQSDRAQEGIRLESRDAERRRGLMQALRREVEVLARLAHATA